MSSIFDRVQEASTTTGTGDFTLAGAYTGYRAFSEVCSVGMAVPYCIVRLDANGNETSEWEVGEGTYSASNTLTRTTVEASSNAGAAVNFSAGNKRVFIDASAKLVRGSHTITLLVSDPGGSAITTGDGKAYYRVPAAFNGCNLVGVAAALSTASSSGIPTVQIANVTQAADMLSTKLTIDANETDSSSAATAAVIDTANDDVATGDQLRIDIDVAGTGAKGLQVELTFRLP